MDAEAFGFEVVVTFTDANGAADTRTFELTVTDVPLLAAVGAQTDAEGEAVSLATAVGATGGVTYAASGLPDGLGIDPSSGLVTRRPQYGNATPDAAGAFTVVIAASYGGSVVESHTVEWTVNDTNRLAAIADQEEVEGWEVELQVEATDLIGNALTFSAIDLPGGLSIDPTTGLISGELAGPDSLDPVEVTVSVMGGGGTDEQTFEWMVIPGLTGDPIEDQFHRVGLAILLPVVATIGGTLTLAYSATGLPTGLTITPGTGQITGQVIEEGTYDVEVAMTCGPYVSTLCFKWWVVPATTDDRLPFPVGEESTAVVAMFTLSTNMEASEYAATISWGDGQTRLGDVSDEGGICVIRGTHAYAIEGVFAVQITLTHLGVPVAVGTLADWMAATTVLVTPPVIGLEPADLVLGEIPLRAMLDRIIANKRALTTDEMRLAFEIYRLGPGTTPALAKTMLVLPDGRLVMGVDSVKEGLGTDIHDELTGEAIRTADFKPSNRRSLAFARGGSWLLVGTNGVVCVYDTATGRRLHRVFLGPFAMNSIAVSPDDKWLVTLCHDDEDGLKVWKLNDW